jgi:hypothetical protein
MMNKITLLLFSAAIFMAVVSCKKDTEVNKNTFKIAHEEVIATTQSVKIIGSYDYAGTIDGITLELGRQADLKDADAYRTLLDDTDFSIEVKNLRTNTTYYYRYSVEYGGKTPYLTEIKSFKTEEYNLPEVKSKEVVSVGVNHAEVNGEVISDGGGDAVTLRGICWSMSHNPSVGDEYTNAGEGIGLFTCELTNLQPEKTYYARAFAGNSKGVSYGEELTFVTLAAGSLAEVHTIGITGNVMLQATVSGEVTDEGTSAVLERGVCYGKEHYPTTNGLHVSSGSGVGEYSCLLMNLEANVTYYVRAYAINSMGIAYGEEMSFVAMTETTVPVVKTNMVNGITQTSATGHGTVVSDGGATVTRRGLCWSTSHNPTVDGIHADCGNGVGDFSGLMPHLTDLTTYYVRAFAENAIGMAYGEEVSFTVGQHGVQYTISISANPIDGGTVSGGGTYQYGQTCTVTATANSGYAFVNWTESSSEVFTEASYTFIVTGDRILVANFTLQVLPPTVVTDPVTNITQTSATGGGTVTGDGNATVIERGICWSTSHDPNLDGNHGSNGTGTGSFSVNMTDLTPNTTYYVCAYAINAQGTAYGDEVSFVTSDLPQYTISVSANPSDGGTVTGEGNYQQGQQCTVTAIANDGYSFAHWTENENVISTEANYSFIVNEDRTLVANFTLNSSPWSLLATFTAPEAGQYGVVTDGQNIYTCNWGYNAASWDFYKYDMQGNVIEGFNVAGCTAIRDLTYDGQYFYGGANDAVLYCIDLANHTLIGTTNTACSGIRHCSYDPVNDGFWVGDWNSLMFINRMGAIISNGPSVSSVTGTGYFEDEDGTPHLYLFTQANSDAKVYDYDILTNTVGAMLKDFATTPGYVSGTSGGAFIGGYNGRIAFFGNLQQDPNLIGIYELRVRGIKTR